MAGTQESYKTEAWTGRPEAFLENQLRLLLPRGEQTIKGDTLEVVEQVASAVQEVRERQELLHILEDLRDRRHEFRSVEAHGQRITAMLTEPRGDVWRIEVKFVRKEH